MLRRLADYRKDIYSHLNPHAAFPIEEKWSVTNDFDVFAQWIDTIV